MEIRQLEYFRKIALTGSINEAARQLNMSQPPLSYQLKLLEEELDVVLFERSRQGVTMTEAGKLLYQRSEELLQFADSTKLEVSQLGKRQVCCGAGSSMFPWCAPPCSWTIWTTSFSARNP